VADVIEGCAVQTEQTAGCIVSQELQLGLGDGPAAAAAKVNYR
jgi:hypothetical protein